MFTAIITELEPENFFAPEKLTLVGVLLAVIWAIMTRRLVPGHFYEDLKRENDELRRALDRWRDTGRAMAGTADELFRQGPGGRPEPPAHPLLLPPNPDPPQQDGP